MFPQYQSRQIKPRFEWHPRMDSNHPLSVGCVGLWLLNEAGGLSAYDLSGNNNHGTLTNQPTWTSGRFGQALSFDGVNDYVDCGNKASLNPTEALTVESWVKFNFLDYTGKTGELLAIAGKGFPDAADPNYGWWFSYDNRNNRKAFHYTCFGNSAGGYAGGVNNFAGTAYGYTFSTGVWYHLAFTITQTEAKLFINGAQHGPTKSISNLQLADTTRTLRIGKLSSVNSYWDGLIDEVRIYNRALTSEEILEHYIVVKELFG